jgi:hypothetical protein
VCHNNYVGLVANMEKIIALIIGIIIFILGLLFCRIKLERRLGYFLMVFSIPAGISIANYHSMKFQWNNTSMQTMNSEIRDLRTQISQSVNLKQNITQTVNNIVKVEVQKEIANLHDTLIQEDKARVREGFSKQDLDKKVKKVEPPDNAPSDAAALVMIELNKVPLPNSIIVQTQSQILASYTIQLVKNILEVRFLRHLPPDILRGDYDFIEVSYTPDPDSNQGLYSLEGFKIKYNSNGNGVLFFQDKQS